VLRSLTWEPEEETRLQVFGAQYLTSMSHEEVADLIDKVEGKYDEMDVIEAYVILHEHTERLRGTPLIRATVRLFTNRGRFAGTGEEYGADAAIRGALDRLERNVLDEKSHELADRRNDDPKASQAKEQAEDVLDWWVQR
jgi:ribosome-associated translation inhibitor RaiA